MILLMPIVVFQVLKCYPDITKTGISQNSKGGNGVIVVKYYLSKLIEDGNNSHSPPFLNMKPKDLQNR